MPWYIYLSGFLYSGIRKPYAPVRYHSLSHKHLQGFSALLQTGGAYSALHCCSHTGWLQTVQSQKAVFLPLYSGLPEESFPALKRFQIQWHPLHSPQIILLRKDSVFRRLPYQMPLLPVPVRCHPPHMPFRLRLLLQDGMHFLHFLQEVPAHSLISPDVPQRYWYESALLRRIRIPHGFPVPVPAQTD